MTALIVRHLKKVSIAKVPILSYTAPVLRGNLKRSYATAVRKTLETKSTHLLSTVLSSHSAPFKISYTSSEIFQRSIESILKVSLPNTHKEIVSSHSKVPECNIYPPDFDFKTITNLKKLEEDCQVNKNNKTTGKVFKYYKTPQLSEREQISSPRQVSNSTVKQSNSIKHNSTVTNDGTKSSSHVRSFGPVPESMADFSLEESKVFQ
ncbi:hypothetical protein AVEN_153685-1 [Araneus ventricosus]|uniref:Uncharacterized protein n=1 Tax=Araneus ventricosus TaxID=182803 RepID=A0A4Y2G297_ARAVE|nr:hypothetical protein AVEN_153685-1 [Araneus ventricosus]